MLVFEEDVFGGEEDDLVLLLAHREEQLHVDLVEPVLLQLPTALYLVALLRLPHPQLLQTVVLLQLVHLQLEVAVAQYLALPYAYLRLEFEEVLIPPYPMVQFSDGVEGRQFLGVEQLFVVVKRGLKVVGEEKFDVCEVQRLSFVEDVEGLCFGLALSLDDGALPFEVVLVVVIL